jgi:gluconolactonase
MKLRICGLRRTAWVFSGAFALLACSSGGAPGSAPGPDAAGGPRADAGDAGSTLVFSDIGTPVLLSNQFYFTEGPVWNPDAGVLYFTDINRPQDGGSVGGAIYRLTPPDTFDVLFEPSGNADGLALERDGTLVAAGFASRSVWRLAPSQTMQAAAPCAADSGTDGGTCYDGSPINTPDDVTVRSDGVIYFTDPTFGSGAQGLPTQTLPLSGAQGVYRLTTDGTLHLEDQSTSGPNGVNLSPDEKTLYVSYTLTGEVAKFDVSTDGSLSNKTTFATGATVADSMCVDSVGDVYVGTLSGLAVFEPGGRSLGTISVGGLIVTNCAFGGTGQSTLFITARTQATLTGAPPMGGGALYSITNMPVAGIPWQN